MAHLIVGFAPRGELDVEVMVFWRDKTGNEGTGIHPKLYQKGDGHALMISDFRSSGFDFGYSPTSLDGKRTPARRFLKPRLKNHERHFANKDVLEQANELTGILDEVYMYPTMSMCLFTTTRQPTANALTDHYVSARLMPKFMSEHAMNFGVLMLPLPSRDAHGKPLYTKTQPLEGLFKGIAVILSVEERGLEERLGTERWEALAAVPLPMMQRFANRSRKFVDAYANGLNRRQAAWAARRYRGHHIVPGSILDKLESVGII
ncbi:hypothetical protein B0H11DRAFT_1904376 [Mycena galericulata]|nr:hypothetical protein B0H11DRAFT_1904376 [Mycena galericulata]